jgi:hypothetical protein
MAYADYLEEQGDPRGEFIQVQLALEDSGRGAAERVGLKHREEELLARHQAEWIGEAAPVFVWPRSWAWDERDSWPFGLEHLDGSPDSPPVLFSRGWIEYLDLHDVNGPFLKALGESPTIRFLRHLILPHAAYPDRCYDRLARWPCLEHLRTFQVGRDPDSRSDSGDVSPVVSRMKRLEVLALYYMGIEDEGIAALVYSGVIRRLRVLDLAGNRVTDEGARLLARSTELVRLERLRLSRNLLTPRGVRELRATGVNLEADDQFDADTQEGRDHLSDGDWE